jgi:hypothetical protein
MQLGRIIIFPIKSLDGLLVESARFTAGGILENDRLFAIYDTAGKAVNGKRTARIHELRCAFDLPIHEVRLWANGQTPQQFQMDDPAPIEKWLGEFFGFPVLLWHETEKGFPTIGKPSDPRLSAKPACTRSRAGFRIDARESAPGELKPFQIGDVKFFGHNPCQ